MISVAKESRPGPVVEFVGRTISSFLGRLPLAAANRGKNSEDPTVELEFLTDPMTYHVRLKRKLLSIRSPVSFLTSRPKQTKRENCVSPRAWLVLRE
jgi:hypothetical protein